MEAGVEADRGTTAARPPATGSRSTRRFHGFEAGKIRHFGAGGSGCDAAGVATTTASSEASRSGRAAAVNLHGFGIGIRQLDD